MGGIVSCETDGLVGIVGHAACFRILRLEELAQSDRFVLEQRSIPVCGKAGT